MSPNHKPAPSEAYPLESKSQGALLLTPRPWASQGVPSPSGQTQLEILTTNGY